MYVGTDTLWLDSEGRFTIWLVPESLARALVASSSLEVFKISFNHIGDIGIAHIAIALQANNTLKSLTLDIYDTYTPTDKAALSLATALTTNTSMEYVKLSWTSTNPGTTLKTIAKCIKRSNLRELKLKILTPQPLGEP